MDTVIVIMQKNSQTGMLEKELYTLDAYEYEKFIINIYAMEKSIYLKLSTDKDVLDWQYNAFYDYYDTDIFKNDNVVIIECEDEYNPTWQFEFSHLILENEILDFILYLLKKHSIEIESIYNVIEENKGDYIDEQ